MYGAERLLRLKPRRDSFVPSDYGNQLKLTHCIRIPLLSNRSRAQLEGFRRRLMTDPVTRHIPDEAFCWPERMSLSLGALSLPSTKAFNDAEAHLKGLDLKELLQQLRGKCRDNSCWETPESKTGQPIRVSLVGLEQLKDPSYYQGSHRLYAQLLDAEGVLSDLVEMIVASFLQAGFMKRTPLQKDRTILHIKIIDSARLGSTELVDKASVVRHFPKGIVDHKRLGFNVEDLFAKYHDFDWASDIALEKLSINQLGLCNYKRGERTIGQGYPEVASVPLPGASDLDLHENIEDITYKPVRTLHGFIPGATYDVTNRQ